MRIILFILSVFIFKYSYTQQVKGNHFLQGNYVEIGIAPNGSFGSNTNAPSNYHTRTNPQYLHIYNAQEGASMKSRTLGFVVDNEKNGFDQTNQELASNTPPFYGDFFTAALPHEGWGIQLNGKDHYAYSSHYTNYTDFYVLGNGGTSIDYPSGFKGDIKGSNVSYDDSGDVTLSVWEGSLNDLKIKMTTKLPKDKQYFVGSVEFVNNSSTDITDMYFMRTVDPDMDFATYMEYIGGAQGGGLNMNSIELKADATNEKTLVSSHGIHYPDAYMALGTKYCNVIPFLGNGAPEVIVTEPLDEIYNNQLASLYTQDLVSNIRANISIGLIFKIDELKAGEGTKISYTYVLNVGDVDEALDETDPNLDYDNISNFPTGEIGGCPGETITIKIDNHEYINWTWPVLPNLTQISDYEAEYVMDANIADFTIDGVGICNKSYSIPVKILPVPAPPIASSNQVFCDGVVALMETKDWGSDYTVDWFYNPTDATPFHTGYTYQGVPGNYYYQTRNIQYGCVSARIPFNPTINPIPAIPSNVRLNKCPTQNPVIADIEVDFDPNATLKWYSDANLTIEMNPSDVLVTNTTYYLTQKLNGCESQSVGFLYTGIPTPLDNVTTENDYCPDNTITLRVRNNDSNFEVNWQDENGVTLKQNSTDIEIDTDGVYYAVPVHRNFGCDGEKIEFIVKEKPFTPVLKANTTSIFRGEEVELDVTAGYDYSWNIGASTNTITDRPISDFTYNVEVTDLALQCTTVLSKNVEVKNWSVEISGNPIICSNSSTYLEVDSPLSNVSYVWSTGVTGDKIFVTNQDTYWVEGTIGNYTQRDTRQVKFTDLELNQADVNGCIQFMDIFPFGGKPPYQYSLDNITFQNSNRFLNQTEGKKTVYVKDADQCIVDAKALIPSVSIKNFISPNNDFQFDRWIPSGLDKCKNARVKIFSRYGKLVFEGSIMDAWNGTDFGKPLLTTDYWYIIEFNDGVNPPLKGNIHLNR